MEGHHPNNSEMNSKKQNLEDNAKHNQQHSDYCLFGFRPSSSILPPKNTTFRKFDLSKSSGKINLKIFFHVVTPFSLVDRST
jgi:hypothetical protein